MKHMSSSNILIVGLGIGSMYEQILRKAEIYSVHTMDINPEKLPDFITFDQVKEYCKIQGEGFKFDLIIVSVPNHLHESVVDELKDFGKLFLVDKPGFQTEEKWAEKLKSVKMVMVKNNIYRDEMMDLRHAHPDHIFIVWDNRNRIPHPGSWFTTKEKAFGGVSRDLLPHLLSIYFTIYGTTRSTVASKCDQYFRLSDIDSTDYGDVNKEGIFDVDDQCYVEFRNAVLCASWKDATGLLKDDSFRIEYGGTILDLGLCPEYAYFKMIQEMLSLTDDIYRWHNKIDLKIHSILDDLL